MRKNCSLFNPTPFHQLSQSIKKDRTLSLIKKHLSHENLKKIITERLFITLPCNNSAISAAIIFSAPPRTLLQKTRKEH